jgi:uncharacterized membrane protein YheB (UPF0754 family)
MASITVDSLQENLLDPRELIDAIDIDELLAEIEAPLNASIDDISEAVAQHHVPGAWDLLPVAGRELVKRRARAAAPDATRRLLAEVRQHLDELLDLRDIVVTTLISDKTSLVRVFYGLGGSAFGFIKRAGLGFGFAIGVVQTLALLVTGEKLLLPGFGLLVGGLTDYLALRMIFEPQEPGRFLGVIPWHGRMHKLRDEITHDFAGIIVSDILTPATVIEGLLNGPRSDRLFNLVQREVLDAIEEGFPSLARPAVVAAVGGREYQAIKATAAAQAIERLPEHTEHLASYAQRTIDLQALLEERMGQMTPSQFEMLLRPVFKDDEWIVVVVGAALGFFFGELQLHLLLS